MPNKRAANMRNVTTTFDKDDLAKVDAAARAAGMTRSEYMRLAALKLIDELSQRKENDQ